MEKKRAVFRRSVRKFVEQMPVKRFKDTLVAEEPFTLVWQSDDGESERLTSTMRTPGDDLSLAAGSSGSRRAGGVDTAGAATSLTGCGLPDSPNLARDGASAGLVSEAIQRMTNDELVRQL